MPIYTPKTSRTDFKGGKNILASEHFTFIEGGATLDAAKIGSGYVPVGQAIAQDATTGKWTKFVAADIATYADFGILNVDWNCDGVNDGIGWLGTIFGLIAAIPVEAFALVAVAVGLLCGLVALTDDEGES
ncbi:hypothetical protein D4V80_01500 [Listeria monocytogenes]|nr:hypothetical protein [Listeria monocytogenes]